MIDLRSDTLTVPTDAMRSAMACAPVNDDVIDTDPTVARLQELTAEMLGKEAAIYMPSGTMTNQIAVRVHCRPGDELICESHCHIYNYEQGGFAQLSQVVAKPIEGEKCLLKLDQLRNAIRPDNEHVVRTRLVCLENTHNSGGGVIMPYQDVAAICTWARENGLATHLDGARFFNAVVASGIPASEWAQHFDTISVCYSKGLGAPVGSALVGSKDQIAIARRHRKLFGGGMRQSGIIAAGALYAMENNIERLAEDHATAKTIAGAVSQIDGLEIDLDDVHTNIVIFKVDAAMGSADDFCTAAKKAGAWMFPFSHEHVRAVTHMHISEDDAVAAGKVIASVAQDMAGNSDPKASKTIRV